MYYTLRKPRVQTSGSRHPEYTCSQRPSGEGRESGRAGGCARPGHTTLREAEGERKGEGKGDVRVCVMCVCVCGGTFLIIHPFTTAIRF